MSEPFRVEARLRVIYGDTDQMGVVYYANYLRYFEFSRSEYFRARGGNYSELERLGYALPVVSAHCDYKSPARYEDLLRIEAWIPELKRVSLRFDYLVHRDSDGVLLAAGHTVHACVGPGGRPARMPPELVRVLAP